MAVQCLPALKKNHGYIQMVLYFTSALLGFFIAVPVGISLRNFQGTCFLFGQIVWDNSVIWPWSESSCDFIIYFNVGLTIIYSFLMGLFMLMVVIPTNTKQYHLVGNYEQHNILYILQGVNPVFIFINSIIAFIVVCMAGTLTGGFIRTCEWTVKAMNEMDNLPGTDYSCLDAQNQIDWENMKIVRGTSRGVDGTRFFNCFIIAAIAAWLLAVVWIFQLVFNVLAGCMVCSCEVAEEKRKMDKTFLEAQRRSRLATPIGTPGGHMQPMSFGHSMPSVHQGAPPQRNYPPPSYGQRSTMGSQSSYGAPPMQDKPRGPPPQRVEMQPLRGRVPTQSFA